MSSLDDYKKKYGGNGVSSSLGDYKERYAKEPAFYERPKAKEPEPVIEPQKEKRKKSQLGRKYLEGVDKVFGRPEEGSRRSQTTLGQLPSAIAENAPFGIGDIVKTARDEPDLFKQVKIEDVLTGIRDTSKGVFAGLVGIGASLAMTPLKFKLPVIGEVTNLQYVASQRIANGEDVGKVILEEGVVNNIFGVLMLAGLASELAAPRHTTTTKTDLPKGTDIQVKNKPQSFRLYEEPTSTTPLSPQTINKLANEPGVNLGKNFDPQLPTYFKMKGGVNGTITGEIVQIKPSYIQTFLGKLKGNINSVPQGQISVLSSKQMTPSQLSEGKIDIVPESVILPKTKSEIVSKIDEYIPALKNSAGDGHLIETVKELAKETGDKKVIKQVDDAIEVSRTNALKETTQIRENAEYIEKATQTPEKELSEPTYVPYKPARAVPVNRVYENNKFIEGTHDGGRYTTNTFIAEFNSDVKAPPKAELITGEKAPSSDSMQQIIPAKENLEEIEIYKVVESEDGKYKSVVLEGDKISVQLQQKYFDYFAKKYRGAKFMAESNTKPVVVIHQGKNVGLIMPQARGGKEITTWERPKAVQPTLESSKEVVKKKPIEKKETKPVEKKETKKKKPERLKITHFTKKENIDKILSEGFDTSLPPIHGVGGLEGGAKIEKIGKDILYFTTDTNRWKTATVYVGEGNGTISRKVFDYDTQKWVEEKNAYDKIDLSPIEAEIKKDASLLNIGSLKTAETYLGKQIDRNTLVTDLITKAKKSGIDILNINDSGVWGEPNGDPTKTGYGVYTGNSGKSDYFVLNKDAIEISKPTKETAKTPKEFKTFDDAVHDAVMKSKGFNPKTDGSTQRYVMNAPTVTELEAMAKKMNNAQPKTPSGTAQAIQNPDTLPKLSKDFGGIEKIRAIEMPELVRLSRELMGDFPTIVKKSGNAAGRFYAEKEGRIKLIAELFNKKGNDSSQAARVLAHEVGHLTDYLPDKNLKRGNLLGRLQTLSKFMKAEFESVDGVVKNSVVKKELLAVTQYWTPYNPATVKESYRKYRESAVELYAEAVSMLFNDPAKLEAMAPTFYREFFNGLDAKPQVKRAYFELQELLAGNREELIRARMDDVEKGFQRAADLQKEFDAKKKLSDRSFFEKLRTQLDDANYASTKKQNKAEANGLVLSDAENPRFALEELAMTGNDSFLFAQEVQTLIQPLLDANVTVNDMGKFLLLSRITTGRAEIANPFGFNAENATELLNSIKEDIGSENYKLLEKQMQGFHELVYAETLNAVKEGSYNAELHETSIKPNKDNYASFRVVDYMQDFVPANVKAQVGTIKEIENPLITTVLKTISLQRLNALQHAKNAEISALKKEGEHIVKSQFSMNSAGQKKFRDSGDWGRLEVLEDGKMQSYDVDPYIAEMYQKMGPSELNEVVKIVEMMGNKVFKPLYTTYNLGFALGFNPIRDFSRNWKNIKSAPGTFGDEVHVFDLLNAYVRSLPQAVKYAKGELDDFTRSLVESKAMEAPMNDYNFDPETGGQVDELLAKYGISPAAKTGGVPMSAAKVMLKPVTQLLEGMRFIANTLEIVSKIAGAKVRIQRDPNISSGKLAHDLRNFTGTPNWRKKGTQTKTTNAIFMFSNIFKEGYKTDSQMATQPKTRGGWWRKTVKKEIGAKLLMFLASAGVFGDDLKDFYDKQSEYDKTNYNVIPLGFTEEGKAIAIRIPSDEGGRLIGAIFWKMMNTAYKGDPEGLQQIFAFGAGQLPSVSPAINIAGVWSQYIGGQNPYDTFRGKNIIDNTTWNAGGGAALKKMVYWTVNQSGQVNLATYDTSSESGVEKAIRVTPLINRFIRITDYGIKEQAKEITEPVIQQAARDVIKEREVISEYIGDMRKRGDEKLTRKEMNQVAIDIIGHKYSNKEEKQRYDRIMKKIELRSLRGTDIRLETLIDTRTNKEKLALFEAYKDGMSPNEYADLVRSAYKNDIISPTLLRDVRHID